MRMKTLMVCAMTALIAMPALADPITLTGNFLKVGISDFGTLGSDFSNSPGILHDPTGMGNFGNNDYLTPGSPHEGFILRGDQFGGDNDNYGDNAFAFTAPTLLTGAAANGYENAATSSGSNDFVNITNSYFFNFGDQRILIYTTITALSDVTRLAFTRSLDPDPDVNTFGSFETNNQRGNAIFSASDFVGAAGPRTGLTIALANLSGNTYIHNTLIGVGDCCDSQDPFTVLAGNGVDSSTGDDSINLAYLIGDLARGQSATLNYEYTVGNNIQTVGGPSSAPEPASWAMMVGGFGLLGGVLRRRSSHVITA